MMRRVWTSLLCGAGVSVVFFASSACVRYFFPYRDKPQMPNLFTWFLIPGLAVASTDPFGQHQVLALATVITINTLVYGFIVFCLLSIVKLISQNSTAQDANRNTVAK